ncbi:MAG TPA: hypothetical protein VK858_13815, partial [Longimicrobiales bacterium]|nr:hypothetical protein [Longimicrobiales bacterium]
MTPGSPPLHWIRPACRLWLGIWLTSATACAPSGSGDAPDDVLHVQPPTGEAETDRTRVQAAFDSVPPGGTVQFAQGTY